MGEILPISSKASHILSAGLTLSTDGKYPVKDRLIDINDRRTKINWIHYNAESQVL